MPDFIAVLKTPRLALAFMLGTALAVPPSYLSAQPLPTQASPAQSLSAQILQRNNTTSVTPETLVTQLPSINEGSGRWYQVEITLFLHSFYDAEAEVWQGVDSLTASSAGTTSLLSLTELLALPEWSEAEPAEEVSLTAINQQRPPQNRNSRSRGNFIEPEVAAEQEEAPAPLINGPDVAHQSNFRIPDPETDGFIALLPEDWQFTETNAALQRSPNYRVLFHSAWRQPMQLANATQDIVITGGRQIDGRHELEGTLRFHFNRRRDRIILDNELLFNIWDTAEPGSFRNSNPQIVQSIPVTTTRELRSEEFHYLDHPIVGALVEVFPYELEASE